MKWRKSSRSSEHNCVEVGFVSRAVAIRDSKNVAGPVLTIPTAGWEAFRAKQA